MIDEHEAAAMLRDLAAALEYYGQAFTLWYVRYLLTLEEVERRQRAALPHPDFWEVTIAACPQDVRRKLYAYRASEENPS